MKVDDRVKINFKTIPGYFDLGDENPENVSGTIVDVCEKRKDDDLEINVIWDNGYDNSYDEIHLINIDK